MKSAGGTHIFSSAEVSPLAFAGPIAKITGLGRKAGPGAKSPEYGGPERPERPPIQPLYLRFPAA